MVLETPKEPFKKKYLCLDLILKDSYPVGLEQPGDRRCFMEGCEA